MVAFMARWPSGIYDTDPKTLHTMAVVCKHVKLDSDKVYDTETIYARAMGLQCSARNLDTNHLLSHELAPYPMSMFDSKGHMHAAKSKSNIKNSLKVEISSRLAETFLDGSAIVWVVSWPIKGAVQDCLV